MSPVDETPEQRTARILGTIRALGIFDVLEIIAAEFAVTVSDVVSRSRLKSVAAARHTCWLALSEVHGKSSTEIGRIFEVDHSTVVDGWRGARKRIAAKHQEEVRDAA